jgi:hypothetical protein
MRTCWLLGLFCLFFHPAFAEEAPFGLRWGATFEELKGRGISGDVTEDDGQMRIVQIATLPEAPGSTEFVRLGVDRRYGLQRILWVSKDLGDDPTGKKGVALYKTMKRSLSDQFGEPRSADEEIGESGDFGPNAFYQCLAEDGCGVFVTLWRTADTDGRLRLIGTKAGKGWLEAVFIGPDWSDIVSDKRKKGRP